MKNKNLNYWRQEISIKENRLCAEVGSGAEDLSNISETIEASEHLRENADLMTALEIYDNPIVIRRYEEILSSASEERPYLVTLLLDGIIDDSATDTGPDGAIDYRDIERGDINPADPFNIISRFEGLSSAAKEEAVGKLLNSSVPVQVLREIAGPSSNSALGKEYIRLVNLANDSWESGNTINPNNILINVSLSYYQHTQQQIAEQMGEIGVRKPNLTLDYLGDRADPSSVEGRTLSREEYLLYMKRSLDGDPDIDTSNIPSLKGSLQSGDEDARTTEIFTDQSLEKFGPTVTLDRFGISLGPQLSQMYVATQRAQVDMEVASASQWLYDPSLSFEFLSENLPTSFNSSNKTFLDSLEYYFVFSEEDRSNMTPDPLMPEEDVRAALTLIVQSLLNVEGVMTETIRQRTDLQNEVSVFQTMEDFMRDSVDYLKDYQSHPLGSAMVGLAGIYAARIIFRNLFKSEARLWTLGALGVTAFTIMQKHRSGSSWAGQGFDFFDDMIRGDQLEDPENRTLPNYWLRELENTTWTPNFYDDLNGTKELTCLSIVGEMPITGVLDWYQDWCTWRMNPSQVAMPDIPEQYRRYRDRFGNSTSRDQIGNYMYLTLHKFFVHRGTDVKDAGLVYDIPEGMSGEEGLGVAYIRDKYLEHREYTRLVSEPGVTFDINMTTLELNLKDSEGSPISIDELERDYPNYYAVYAEFLNKSGEQRESALRALNFLTRSTGTSETTALVGGYPFDHVLLFERNSEVMRLRDLENADAAGALTSMWSRISTIGGDSEPDNRRPTINRGQEEESATDSLGPEMLSPSANVGDGNFNPITGTGEAGESAAGNLGPETASPTSGLGESEEEASGNQGVQPDENLSSTSGPGT
jgi:hypothetical protein